MIFSQENKIITVLSPVDNTGAAATVCDVVNMKNYNQATFIISFGAVNDSMTGTLVAYKGASVSSCTTAFAAKYSYGATNGCVAGTGGDDTQSALLELPATGVSLAAGDAADATANPCTIIVKVDAQDLGDGYSCVRVGWTNSEHSTLVSIVCILSEPRYADASLPTAIS